MTYESLSTMEQAPITGKFYCFTLNNPTDEEFSKIHATGIISEHLKYLVFGHETGGKHMVEHLQGYLELKKAV